MTGRKCVERRLLSPYFLPITLSGVSLYYKSNTKNMATEPIPIEQRSELLKPLLKEMLVEIYRLKSTELLTTSPYPLSLYNIIFPWFVQEDYKTSETEAAKAKFVEFGVQGDEFGNKLEAVLNNDHHLKECCVNILVFASLIDKFIGNFLEGNTNQIPDDNKFDADFDAFVTRIYEEPFRAFAFSHVFNFSAFADHLDFGNLNIRKVSTQEIPYLLGESTSFSFLHPYQSGEYFVVAEAEGVIENDLQRMREAHEAAEQLIRIFQYFKDGVVHLNYTANFFRPIWLNNLRKYGMLYWGDNRRLSYEQGQKMYSLDLGEHDELKRWWNLFCQPEILEKFGETRNVLGKTIEFAGSYYESSHLQTEYVRRLIDLSIALEAAFSPHHEGEISFQLSQLTAEFIGSTPQEKTEIFDFVRKAYKKRSELLHGSPKSYDDEFVQLKELEKFSSIIRRGILKFVALYINGEENHKDAIEKIRRCLFDPEFRTIFYEKADIHRLIRESPSPIL